MSFVEFNTGFFDNWVYLNRVQLVKYSNKWQEIWVDWLCTAAAAAFVVL